MLLPCVDYASIRLFRQFLLLLPSFAPHPEAEVEEEVREELLASYRAKGRRGGASDEVRRVRYRSTLVQYRCFCAAGTGVLPFPPQMPR
jgi:hypothetical protein